MNVNKRIGGTNMIIPKCFALYLEKRGFSCDNPQKDNTVTIHCKREEQETLKVELQKLLQEKWAEVYEEVKSNWGGEDVRLYNDIGELFVENPFYVQSSDEGLEASFGRRYPIFYNEQGFLRRLGDGSDALDRALAALTEAHKEISYRGHICYSWCDIHGTDTVEYDIRSANLEDNSEGFEIMLDEKVFHILENEIEEFTSEMKEEIMSDIAVEDPKEDDYYSDKYFDRDLGYYEEPGWFFVETLAEMVLYKNRERLLKLLTEIDWEALGIDISDTISEAIEELDLLDNAIDDDEDSEDFDEDYDEDDEER